MLARITKKELMSYIDKMYNEAIGIDRRKTKQSTSILNETTKGYASVWVEKNKALKSKKRGGAR